MKDLNFFHLVGGVYFGSSVIALFPPVDTRLLTFCLVAAGFCILLGEAARGGSSPKEGNVQPKSASPPEGTGEEKA